MSTEELNQAVNLGEEGVSRYGKREFEEAKNKCVEACRRLQALLQKASPQRQALIKDFIKKYLGTAEQASEHLRLAQPKLANQKNDNSKPVARRETLPKKGVSTNVYMKEIEENMLSIGNEVSFSDIVGLDHVKQVLNETIIYPALRPDIYKGIRAPAKGILFYGPPGNGKTMLAKAVAAESQYTFFNVSAGTLVSKWVGDSEKMLKALFDCAKERQPSIIFIDEIDSLLTSRNENEHEGTTLFNTATRRLKTEFLIQLDGASTNPDDKILVIGATNLPNQLDKAALRRFTKKVLIDLPDQKARKGLIAKLLNKAPHNLTDSDINDVAYRMELYSANDVKIAVKDAAMAPLREYTYDQLLLLPKERLRPIEKKDLLKAVKDNPASLSNKDYERYKKFGSERRNRNTEHVGAGTQQFEVEDDSPMKDGSQSSRSKSPTRRTGMMIEPQLKPNHNPLHTSGPITTTSVQPRFVVFNHALPAAQPKNYFEGIPVIQEEEPVQTKPQPQQSLLRRIVSGLTSPFY